MCDNDSLSDVLHTFLLIFIITLLDKEE